MYLIIKKIMPEERSQNLIITDTSFCKCTSLLLEAHYILLTASCQRKSGSAATSYVILFLSICLFLSQIFSPMLLCMSDKENASFLICLFSSIPFRNTRLRIFL